MIDTKLAGLIKPNTQVRGIKKGNEYILSLDGFIVVRVKHLPSLPKFYAKLITTAKISDTGEPALWENIERLFEKHIRDFTAVHDSRITVNTLDPNGEKYDIGFFGNTTVTTAANRKYTNVFDSKEAPYVEHAESAKPQPLHFVRDSEIIGVVMPYRLDFADVVKNTLPSIVKQLKEGADNANNNV